MKKKITLALALVLTFAAISTSCIPDEQNTDPNTVDGTQTEQNTETDGTSDDASSENLVLPEAVVDENDSKIVMKVEGRDISYAMLRYFILNYRDQYAGNNEELWEASAIEEIKNITAIGILGEDLGAEMPEDYKKQNIDDIIAATINGSNADENTSYEKELETYYLTDVLFRDIQAKMALQNYIYSEYYTEGKSFFDVDDADILSFINENYVRVKHILIKTVDLDDAEKASKRADAESILERARGGESFEELVTAYSEDGMNVETGYYFTYDEMVPEFEEESFALEVGEISDIVESTYGYHIIKKYEMEDDYILSDETLRTAALNNITVNKFVDEVFAKSDSLTVEYTDIYDQALAEILAE